MTLSEIKVAIWTHKRINRNPVDLQVYADKAGVRLPITQIHEAEKLLKSLTRKVKLKVDIPGWCIQRYNEAHKEWFRLEYPAAFKDGHYFPPDFPDIGTSNGLTSFIIKYATWMGCHGNRVSSAGRKIGDKWIPGSTKKGTADVLLIIHGRSVSIEVKVGRDKPSQAQLKEQDKVRRASGIYEFIHNPEEFFNVFDRVYLKQGGIFDNATRLHNKII